METIKIIEKDLKPPISLQLKRLEVSDNNALEIPISRESTLRNSIQKVQKDTGYKFLTRTEDKFIYVWRIA